jgi:hypothetical protein
MKGNRYSQSSVPVDSVASLRTQQFEIRTQEKFSASCAVSRGFLGIHLDGGREDFFAETQFTFF